MRKKLMRSLLACTLVTAVLIFALVSGWLYSFFQQQLEESLRSLSDAISTPLSSTENPVAFLAEGIYSRRVTLIDQQGCVIFDNRSDIASLPNHTGRTEVSDAFAEGEGWAKHLSDTLGEISVYYARRLPNGMVLRISDTQASIFTALTEAMSLLMAGIILCVVLCAALAKELTRHLVLPVNSIDLNNPMDNDVYDELKPMLQRMAEQNKALAEQMRNLRSQRAELDAVVAGMREGLVLLDKHQRVLVMNPAACAMLNVQDEHKGHLLSEVTENETVLTLAEEHKGVSEMHIGQQIVRVSISPVSDGGMAILFQDVTAARRAEQSRRQFSANVSHELRTPLTTISGYAEMLSSGMANPADAGFLGGKIHEESRRLLSLIEDILRLSRMDEEIPRELQPVDLHALAQHCADKLSPHSRRAQVTVEVKGARVIVPGDSSLLEEMITNLVENAIKYNKIDGTVTVETGSRDGRAFLSVTDTGVGIPLEHQSRVFERFYRVDKSRSKQTGGTGLGLSIVKHGAQLHRATVDLKSTPGKGTCITLQF